MEILSPISSRFSTQAPLGRDSPKKSSARRCLFGTPSKEKNDEFVKRLLDVIHEEKKAKWEFDFLSDSPLPSSSGSRFVYMPVNATDVPGFYRASSLGAEETMGSDLENNDPNNISSSDDSFRSEEENAFAVMETSESETFSPGQEVPLCTAKKNIATPKKRQTKLTDFLATRKNLQRTAKKSDLTKSPMSPKASRTSRRITRSLLSA
jgi:hypothetical protein